MFNDFALWATEEGRERIKIDSVAAEYGKTAYLCEVVGVSQIKKDGRIMTTVDIDPLVQQLSNDNKPIAHETIYNVTCQDFSAGDVAIIIKPKVGDIGTALICHDDISGVKRSMGHKSPPVSNRHNSHSDSVYLGAVMKKEPKTYIIVEDDKVTVHSKKVVLEAEETTVKGKLIVDGDVTTKAGITNKGVNIGNTHKHSGVQSGAGITGVVAG